MMSPCSLCSRVLLWVVVCLAALVASPALAQPSLPAPWIAADIGSPSLTGSTTYGNGTFTVSGGGMGVTGRNDQFHFLYQRLSGDAMIAARIDGLTAADAESRVGVMFRESLSANSINAFAYLNSANGLGLSSRTSTRTKNTTMSWGSGTAWLALRRQGSTLTGYVSSDGSNWQPLSTSSVPLGQSVYVGIAISGRSNTARAQARVSSVSVTGGLPNGQRAADVGSPAPAGNTSFTNGVYSMQAGGANIGGNSDQFHFAYQTVNGDVDLIARVASVAAADAMSRAGVMVRASLSANAAFAYTSLRAGGGHGFEWRYTSSASASVIDDRSSVASRWVRLTRRGQQFRAYRSADGQTWALVHSMNVDMPTTVYVGLAATSARASASTTATVDNFAVNTNLSNGAPTVSFTSPTAGESWTAPATISLAANASDPEDRLSRVEFYAGTQLLFTDTSAPYAYTWTNVSAGTHAVRARALDLDGGQAESSMSVTVSAPNSPPIVTLTSPSAGHSFAAGATITLAANASDPEQRMGRVDFLINGAVRGTSASAPYSATWSTSGTSAGTYTIAAVAYDAEGLWTRSAEITVTVSAPTTTPPRHVVFTASTDHTTRVTRYELRIYQAGANTSTATPVATSDLGKPTPDAQQTITVDRSSFFTALPTGSYAATVMAIGPGGSAQSQPPVSFVR